MSFVSSGDHTGSPASAQQSALIVGVNLLCPGGAIVGEITLPRRLGDIVEEIIRRINPGQDNTPARTLQEIVDTPEFAERKLENRRIGRLLASETRRRQRETDLPRETALRLAAEDRGRSFSEAEILVKLHHRARAPQIDRFRTAIINRCKRDGLSNRKIAERLHVTPQHVGRIIAEMKDKEIQ